MLSQRSWTEKNICSVVTFTWTSRKVKLSLYRKSVCSSWHEVWRIDIGWKGAQGTSEDDGIPFFVFMWWWFTQVYVFAKTNHTVHSKWVQYTSTIVVFKTLIVSLVLSWRVYLKLLCCGQKHVYSYNFVYWLCQLHSLISSVLYYLQVFMLKLLIKNLNVTEAKFKVTQRYCYIIKLNTHTI